MVLTCYGRGAEKGREGGNERERVGLGISKIKNKPIITHQMCFTN